MNAPFMCLCRKFLLILALVVGGISESNAQADALRAIELQPRLRRPAALALVDEGQLLFVANHRSGTVSVIDTAALQTVAEMEVGRKLSDLASTPDGRHLLVSDEETNEIILLARRAKSIEVLARMPVGASPVSVKLSSDGSKGFMASLWARRLTIVKIFTQDKSSGEPMLQVIGTVPLPFAPRKQLLVHNDSKLIVADSFGGKLAVIDVKRGELESVRTLPAHNIRGLALSSDGERLFVSHQVLSRLAQTVLDDIHWGNLMGNNLRSLPIESVLDQNADLLRGNRVLPLGDVTEGGADPAEIIVSPTGKVVVALGGIAKVAIGRETNYQYQRVSVGQRPGAMAFSVDSQRVYVANTFDDSVSVLDLKNSAVVAEVSLGPQSELSLADRGETLFYDARLSHNGWLSCHSCHTDGHSNGLLNDNLGDDSFGAPKRVLSLLGARDTGPWAWNGSAQSLDDQIHKSILTTMRGADPSAERVAALAHFVRTLKPAPPLRPRTDDTQRDKIERGESLFRDQGCGKCHEPPEYTSPKVYDVALIDEAGNTKFNPPSLRGVGQRDSFFHDNRAHALEEVFTQHRHQLSIELSKRDLADLIDFLKSL